jgi:hypothetical protein
MKINGQTLGFLFTLVTLLSTCSCFYRDQFRARRKQYNDRKPIEFDSPRYRTPRFRSLGRSHISQRRRSLSQLTQNNYSPYYFPGQSQNNSYRDNFSQMKRNSRYSPRGRYLNYPNIGRRIMNNRKEEQSIPNSRKLSLRLYQKKNGASYENETRNEHQTKRDLQSKERKNDEPNKNVKTEINGTLDNGSIKNKKGFSAGHSKKHQRLLFNPFGRRRHRFRVSKRKWKNNQQSQKQIKNSNSSKKNLTNSGDLNKKTKSSGSKISTERGQENKPSFQKQKSISKFRTIQHSLLRWRNRANNIQKHQKALSLASKFWKEIQLKMARYRKKFDYFQKFDRKTIWTKKTLNFRNNREMLYKAAIQMENIEYRDQRKIALELKTKSEKFENDLRKNIAEYYSKKGPSASNWKNIEVSDIFY